MIFPVLLSSYNRKQFHVHANSPSAVCSKSVMKSSVVLVSAVHIIDHPGFIPDLNKLLFSSFCQIDNTNTINICVFVYFVLSGRAPKTVGDCSYSASIGLLIIKR